ncbi:aldo/keto reductase [Fulvivirga sedimenti]|uniref:Aldo/keto reductase n=1 Tax=Fulvivirga sedimenti TaxID=2879465 RepID=A0A9X1HS65_9BACT|nr:aldo/keto reductase [Fulvivirga sedimenti]MCA6075044.1 aldo/keto reductase [Fulvivirga sedimenti]MCA6076221.1 aldo/keto reductase [Fulvivirga sedimenti]MCA6077349.1 aldo/keto reductase [Fulvivirga sedimenti]
MKYNKYIQDAPPVSEIGLGAWQLGVDSGWKVMSEKEAMEMVHKALDYGINFFDTAPNYGYGTGEDRLGRALKGTDRDKIVINTKFGHTDSGTMNYESDYIRKSLEGSLRRLQVDYVDSLIIHNPPSHYLVGNQNDHYEILERLIDEGKIKAYGASLDTYDDMSLLMQTTGAKVIEAFFNILHQDAARAFDMAIQKEVGIIVKIPLDSGWLSGKYDVNSTFDDIRSRWTRKDIQTRARLVERIKEITTASDNLAQLAIAFCLSYDAVSTVIPGNVNLAQLKSNVESINHRVSPEIILELEKFYNDEVKHLNLPW